MTAVSPSSNTPASWGWKELSRSALDRATDRAGRRIGSSSRTRTHREARLLSRSEPVGRPQARFRARVHSSPKKTDRELRTACVHCGVASVQGVAVFVESIREARVERAEL